MSINCCARAAGTLPYKHKIVVAGNHELSFDEKFLQQSRIIGVRFHPVEVREYLFSKSLTKMKDLLVNCTYLEDSETTVFGLRIYGSPWYNELLLSYFLLDLFRCHLWLTKSLGGQIPLPVPNCRKIYLFIVVLTVYR